MRNWISSRRGLIAGGALVSAAGFLLSGSRALAAPDAPHSKNVELILTFCKAGQDRDLEKQMSFIDEDSIYHNMPDAPIVGRAGIRALGEAGVTEPRGAGVRRGAWPVICPFCRGWRAE